MDLSSFIMGGITVMFSYALFSSDQEEEMKDETETNGEEELQVNDFKGRHVILSCQTCRKQRRHKEIEPNLYQCTKCKRHVDLRAS